MDKEYFKERKISVLFTIFLVALGSIAYFVWAVENDDMMKPGPTGDSAEILQGIDLKIGYLDGNIKIFAYTDNNILKNYDTSIGNNVPEFNTMVIGSDEGKMMMDEDLFSEMGDELNDFFGIDTAVEGLLEDTGTYADDFHFLSKGQFEAIEGDEEVLEIAYNGETPKLFYKYDKENPSPVSMKFAQGNINLFYKHIVEGKIYYPVILGAKEAKMMQEEGLFESKGDIIEGFFGRDAMIVGILEETNTSIDMMHIVEYDFFDKDMEPENGVLV